MPITFENTDRLVRHYGSKMQKLSPSFDMTSFLGGIVVGFIVLPILLPIVGYQITKRWGPPG
jgi:hypothetical protein